MIIIRLIPQALLYSIIVLLVATATSVSAADSQKSTDDVVQKLHAALLKTNPDYKGDATIKAVDGIIINVLCRKKPIADLSSLKGLPLQRLDIMMCSEIKDLTPLAGMPLQVLNLGGCAKIDDISTISTLRNLKDLSLTGCKKISNLAPLKGLPLANLSIYDTGVSDITILKGMKLISFNCNHLVSDISALEDMPLKRLTMYRCSKVTDLTPIKNAQLEHINLERSGVNDLAPLKGQPLKFARIYLEAITDISPFENMPLRSLDIGSAHGLKDISIIKSLPELTDLRIDETGIDSIEVVGLLKKLKLLSIHGCKNLKDLSPIKDLPLESLLFTPSSFSKEQLIIVRNMKTLKILGADWKDWQKKQRPEDFWKKYDEGALKVE